MSDADLIAEIEKQAGIQRKYPPNHQMWIAASRISHHLAREKERRSVAKAGPPEEQPT